MKRKIAIIVALTVCCAILLSACGPFVCEFCGKKSIGKTYEMNFQGKKIKICRDCKEGVGSFVDSMDEFLYEDE